MSYSERLGIDSSPVDFANISGNFKCSKKADHILEMAGLGLFCDYRFINHILKLDCKVV